MNCSLSPSDMPLSETQNDGAISEDTRLKWNQRYHGAVQDISSLAPAWVLQEYAYLLPPSAKALDLACGLGANAVFMARRQLQVDAWDISDVAISQLMHWAQQHRLSLQAVVKDVTQQPPEPERYDIIIVSRFLERSIVPRLIQALRPNGLIYYQTFIKDKDPGVGPGNPAFLLEDNELLALFSALKVLVYHELGATGDCRYGLRNEAALVAQKRMG